MNKHNKIIQLVHVNLRAGCAKRRPVLNAGWLNRRARHEFKDRSSDYFGRRPSPRIYLFIYLFIYYASRT